MKRVSLPLAFLVCGLILGGIVADTFLHGQSARSAVSKNAPEDLISFRDIVKKVLPAVVSIETHVKPAKISSSKKKTPQLDPRIPEEFRRFFEDFGRIPFPDESEAPRQGFGSGFFVNPSGVILTNYHVVDGADRVSVKLYDGREFTGRHIKGDKRTDLAIIKLEHQGPFPFLEMGDSSAMEIGDRVLAVGAPFGLTGSVTHGIISAKGRNLHLNMYEDFLQTDAAINPGNSGGPLINLEGKVIGINSAIKTRSGGFQGVGLAIASNLAQKVMKALQTEGVVRRGYLGVQIRELNADVAERLGVKDGGVVIAEVFENTPAAKAGLQAGDIVTSIAGKKVKDGRSLQTIVADLPLNKSTAVELVRDGKHMKLQVTIEEQPAEFGSASAPAPRQPLENRDNVGIDKIGIEVAELTDETAEDLGYKKGTRGVVIMKVNPESVAGLAGLRKGMLILKVDNKSVSTAAAARQALEAASLSRGVLLQVQSPTGGTNYVLLKQSS